MGKAKWFSKLRKVQKRIIGLLLTYLTAIGICYLFIHFIVPQLIDSIMGFVNDVPQYVDNVTRLFNDLMSETNVTLNYAGLIQEQMDKYIQFIMDFAKEIIPIVGNMLKVIASSVWNIVLGIIISVYLFIDKENFFAINRKITCALFQRKLQIEYSN